MNTTFLLTKDYEQITMNNEPTKTNPNKAKQTRTEFTPKGAMIPIDELLGILKPGTNFISPKLLPYIARSAAEGRRRRIERACAKMRYHG